MCGGSNLSVGLHAYVIILFSVGRVCISMKKVLNSKLVTAWQVAFMGKRCFCLVYEDEWSNTNTRPTINGISFASTPLCGTAEMSYSFS